MKVLKQFDLFGHSLTFEEDGSSFFKTNPGTILSYSIIISIIVLGFAIGNEIYERKTPILMNGEEIVGREGSTISLSEFPFIISMSGKFGVPIKQDYRSLFNVDVLYMNTASDGKLSFELFYGFSECIIENYSNDIQDKVTEIIEGIKKNSWNPLCIFHQGKEDFAIANPYSSRDSAAIFFRLTDCNEDKRESANYANKNKDIFKSAPKCDPNRRIVSDSFFLKFDLINSYYNFKSYSSPINNYLYSFTKTLGYGITNSSKMHFGIEKLNSDNGWLFESIAESKIFYFSSSESSTFMMSSDKEIFMLGVGVNNKIKISYRSYMKIQELFAKIGGLFNAFFLIIKLALYDYVRYEFHIKYAKYTIDALDLEKNKQLYPEINTFKQYFSSSQKSNMNIKIKNKQEIIKQNNFSADKNINIEENIKYSNHINNESNANNQYFSNETNDEFNLKGFTKRNISNYGNIIKPVTNISVQPILQSNTITDNNVFSEINNPGENKIKRNNFLSQIDKSASLQPKLNTVNVETENMGKKTFKKQDTLVNLKFKDENNLLLLNNFLLDKVNSLGYCNYFFYTICGCFYSQKPIGYMILDSNYSNDKYSMKYYLKYNKKLRSFERNLNNERIKEKNSLNISY